MDQEFKHTVIHQNSRQVGAALDKKSFFKNKCLCVRRIKKLSVLTRLEKLQNVQKVFVWYSFQPDPCYPPPVCLTFTSTPPVPESARCDYSDLTIANIRLRPSICVFLSCLLSFLTRYELKTWLLKRPNLAHVTFPVQCTHLFSHIFRVSPFAWRCMTCFPRFSAVSL